MSRDEDARFLLRAAALSRSGMDAGDGGPFGALIVRDGRVLAEGWNCVTSAHDPTAHAEVTAIRRACTALGDFTLSGATIYSSCEPCPMCLSAIYWARIDRLVYSNTRQQAAAIGFDDALIYDEVPKAPGERQLSTSHRPISAAEDVFRDWQAKTDKVRY